MITFAALISDRFVGFEKLLGQPGRLRAGLGGSGGAGGAGLRTSARQVGNAEALLLKEGDLKSRGRRSGKGNDAPGSLSDYRRSILL